MSFTINNSDYAQRFFYPDIFWTKVIETDPLYSLVFANSGPPVLPARRKPNPDDKSVKIAIGMASMNAVAGVLIDATKVNAAADAASALLKPKPKVTFLDDITAGPTLRQAPPPMQKSPSMTDLIKSKPTLKKQTQQRPLAPMKKAEQPLPTPLAPGTFDPIDILLSGVVKVEEMDPTHELFLLNEAIYNPPPPPANGTFDPIDILLKGTVEARAMDPGEEDKLKKEIGLIGAKRPVGADRAMFDSINEFANGRASELVDQEMAKNGILTDIVLSVYLKMGGDMDKVLYLKLANGMPLTTEEMSAFKKATIPGPRAEPYQLILSYFKRDGFNKREFIRDWRIRFVDEPLPLLLRKEAEVNDAIDANRSLSALTLEDYLKSGGDMDKVLYLKVASGMPLTTNEMSAFKQEVRLGQSAEPFQLILLYFQLINKGTGFNKRVFNIEWRDHFNEGLPLKLREDAGMKFEDSITRRKSFTHVSDSDDEKKPTTGMVIEVTQEQRDAQIEKDKAEKERVNAEALAATERRKQEAEQRKKDAEMAKASMDATNNFISRATSSNGRGEPESSDDDGW